MISDRDKVTYGEVAEHYSSNKFLFGLKYFRNWLLELFASNCPVPSWRVRMHRMRGVNIAKNAYVGYNVLFDRIHPELITVEEYAEVGDQCILSAHSRGSLTTRKSYPRTVDPIIIRRGVCINPGCIITQGVEIGENSIIGTGSVVSRNISPNSLALGYPAKVVKKLDNEETSTSSDES